MEKYNERLTAVFTTIGAGVLIFFGSLWLVGSIVLSNVQNSMVFIVLFGIAFLILISTFIIFLRRALKLPKEELTPEMIKHSKKIAIHLGWSIYFQAALIVIAIIILQNIERSDLIVPIISIIIGLHFFALIPVFNFKFDYLIGSLIIIWAISVPLVFPLIGVQSNHNPYVWSIVISLGNGLILYIGSVNRFYTVNRILTTPAM